jgi:hypothetical protein
MTNVYGPVKFCSVIYGPFYVQKNHPVKVALNNSGTVAATMTYVATDSGQIIGPESIGPAGATTRTLNNLASFTVNAPAGAILTVQIVDINDEIDPKFLSAGTSVITGTINTDVGQGTAPAAQVVLTTPAPVIGGGTVYDARTVGINGSGVVSPLNLDFSGNVLHNQAAVTSNGGDSEVILNKDITPSSGPIETCPANSKLYFLRAFADIVIDATRLYVSVSNSTVGDSITAFYGTPFNVSGILQIGHGPGNDIVLNSDVILLPGDSLNANVDTGIATFSCEFLQEPL